jgi:hypothetical protein
MVGATTWKVVVFNVVGPVLPKPSFKLFAANSAVHVPSGASVGKKKLASNLALAAEKEAVGVPAVDPSGLFMVIVAVPVVTGLPSGYDAVKKMIIHDPPTYVDLSVEIAGTVNVTAVTAKLLDVSAEAGPVLPKVSVMSLAAIWNL